MIPSLATAGALPDQRSATFHALEASLAETPGIVNLLHRGEHSSEAQIRQVALLAYLALPAPKVPLPASAKWRPT